MIYAQHAEAVTPSDTVELRGASTAGLYVGAGGTLTVTLLDGTKVAMLVVAGLVPIVVRQVWAGGTGATNIIALRL
jgi:hypothetical protein